MHLLWSALGKAKIHAPTELSYCGSMIADSKLKWSDFSPTALLQMIMQTNLEGLCNFLGLVVRKKLDLVSEMSGYIWEGNQKRVDGCFYISV